MDLDLEDFQKIAEDGDVSAQKHFGLLYFFGEEVTQDY